MKWFLLPFLFALFALCYAQKSVDTVAKAGGCSTSAVAGLSTQLVTQMNCMVPGVLKSFAGAANIQYGSAVFPYLQGPAVDKLIQATAAAGRTISINSALRTLPQQYLLYRWNQLGLCGITAAAAPGRSNHNKGLAIDINDYSSWINLLKPYNYAWFGASDVVHFTYTGAGTVDLNTLSVKAFQILWNRNNPSDKIDEDGIYGPATEARVQRSPSTGFAVGPSCSGSPTNGPTNKPTSAPTNKPTSAPTNKPTAVPTQPPSTATCTANGKPGTCINENDCTGTVTAGLCPGASAIKCCTESVQQPVTQCTTSGGSAGTCIDVASCSGTTYSGLCPGPNNIKCCVAGSPPSSNVKTTNVAGIRLIESFEGYYANFYIDPVGIRTIGYGHACHVSDCNNLQAKNEAGTFYRVTPPLSRQAAEDLLRGDLDNLGFEDCVNQYVTRTSVNSNQFSSLVSFTFNLGCGAFKSSTLLKRVNDGSSNAVVRAEFVKWNKAGGKVLAGLTRRRNAEADLYAGIITTTRSMHETRDINTDGVGAECWHYGQKGVCLKTAFCTGFSVAGLCPGPADTQCCLRKKCTALADNDGTCVLATSCAGQVYENATCQGSADLQCCVGPVPEPTTQCPDGSTWNTLNRWCETNDGLRALGPFTRAMLNKCYSSGGNDDICAKQHQFTWSGQAIFLLSWPKDFALRVRGTGDCLLGSAPNNNYQGYCMETVSVGQNSTIVSEVNVYGAMNSVLQDACSAYAGGLACVTPRWSGDFFRTIAQPFHLSIQITASNATVEEEGVDSDTSSNFWVDAQMKLSAEHEVEELFEPSPSPTPAPAQPSSASSFTLALSSVLCVLFLLL